MLKIEVFLKTEEKGCNFSKHFDENFIKNDKLHPKVKEVPMTSGYYDNIPEPEVIVKDENGVIVYSQKGNQVNPSALQEFLMGKLG